MTSDSDDNKPAGTPAQGSATFQHIAVTNHGDVCVAVLLNARLEDLQVVARCKSELMSLAGGGRQVSLVIDFSGVEYASPIALSTLLMLQKAIQGANGSLQICGLNPSMTEMLKVAKLDRMLTIHSTLDGAVSAC